MAVSFMLGAIAWLGLLACLVVSIGLTIREAGRTCPRPARTVREAASAVGDTAVLDSVAAFVTGAEPRRREWYL